MRNIALALAIGCGSPPVVNGPVEPAGDVPTAPATPEPLTAPSDATATLPARRSTPLVGGTLLTASTADDIVYASDPENDRIFALNTDVRRIAWQVDLPRGAEPFRLAEAGGALFVTLRGVGGLARVDLASSELTVLPGCDQPRGLAWDAAREVLFVACAGGELERRAADGALVSSTWIDGDLRDVVPLASTVLVSRFRTAEVLTLDPWTLAVLDRRAPAPVVENEALETEKRFEPHVAWRMIQGKGNEVIVSHQLQQTTEVPLGSGEESNAGAYGTSVECGMVRSVITRFSGGDGQPVSSPAFVSTALPLDIVLHDGDLELLSGADNSLGFVGGLQEQEDATCAESLVQARFSFDGRAAAVAYDGAGRLVVAKQAPFGVFVDYQDMFIHVPAGGPERAFELFHQETPSGLACASCHPEGTDDGHVWQFGGIGLRRTQNLAVGLADTAPFHWDGEFEHTQELLADVMVERMGGRPVSENVAEGLLTWMDGLAPVRVTPSGNADAIARGEALFFSPDLACASCHAGPAYTSAGAQDIGHGMPLETPSLVGVGGRGPWMHDGCALTLEQRFLDAECGGTLHGGTVDPADVPDMVAYLETL